jgi:hypothetical protein
VSWRDPIVPAPTNVAATIAGGGMAIGTYGYAIVARRPAGQGNIATSLPAGLSVTLTAPGSVQLTWTPVPDATEYRVYRTGSGAVYFTTKTAAFTDIGGTGTAGAVPTSASKWLVKNIFELKNAKDVLAERNIFEHNWENGQPGYAIVFTVRNSNGACTWCTVQNVEFRYNVVRHTSSAINVLGLDDAVRPSVRAEILNIHDNLFYDIDTVWGGQGWFLQIGAAPKALVIDHNTIDETGSTMLSVYGGSPTNPLTVPGFRFTNNLTRHGKYGFFASGLTWGQPSIDAYFPDGVITKNVLAGGTSSKYPTSVGNLFPSVADYLSQFVAPSTGDYTLVQGSAYRVAGTDGKDLGADMTQIADVMARVTANQ